ncbi:hypothetical protein [Candidatus Venteria ishoeyi]|uniref:Uncharacterized protein n=1 Tax=Candidatus Venteria ishoeyi TaxID=1899563 RepID=A0A1H6FBI8_9GAMM|nr:hypothetical protein [Candidatus Venteria ishoeyi]SEH06496.1 Uncharacterised protein [Candidatus Venteria ishoeyi]
MKTLNLKQALAVYANYISFLKTPEMRENYISSNLEMLHDEWSKENWIAENQGEPCFAGCRIDIRTAAQKRADEGMAAARGELFYSLESCS